MSTNPTTAQPAAAPAAPAPASPSSTWTIRRMMTWTQGFLAAHHDEHPRLSSQWLICAATKLTRVELFLNFDRVLTNDELACMHKLVAARAEGKPLQYITGEMAFRHIVLRCEEQVLIPRPETEMLVEYALNKLTILHTAPHTPVILEIGTGSGCIALSIASELEHSHVTATDSSPFACSLAQRNARALGLDSAVDIIETSYADGVSPQLKGNVDALISNPPYIPSAVVDTLTSEVRDFEPHAALDGGTDGLRVFRGLLELVPTYVRPGGFFCVELFEDNVQTAAQLCRQSNLFSTVEVTKDLAGRSRFIIATTKGDITAMTKEECERAQARQAKRIAVNQNTPDPAVVKRACDCLANQGVIIVPTDSVYGIGCAATKDNPGLRRTFDIKHRDYAQTLPWLVADASALDTYGIDVPTWAYALAHEFWPGALTLVVKANDKVGVEYQHAATHTIALRLPNSEVVRALARGCGCPLAITSANTHGSSAAVSGDTIEPRLLDEVDLALDAGSAPIGTASTIVDCTHEEPKLLRVGAISPEDIYRVVSSAL